MSRLISVTSSAGSRAPLDSCSPFQSRMSFQLLAVSMWRLWISMYHLRGVDLRASVELGGNGEVRLVCDGRSLEPQALGDCLVPDWSTPAPEVDGAVTALRAPLRAFSARRRATRRGSPARGRP